MKLRFTFALIFAAASLAVAQTPPPSPFQTLAPPPDSVKPAVSPETVVLTVDGKAYKAKELDEWLKQFPPQMKDAVNKNPEAELTRLFALRALSEDARKRNLDQVSPYKEGIDSRVRSYLANVAVQDENTHVQVTQADQEAYYEAHKDQYQSVKISAIYVAYTPNPKPGPDGKMPVTEAEAKAKAAELVKKLRGGADFAKLAEQSSDDKESAKKGGEYATIRRSDSYPPAIKEAIFKLKDGEVSDPVQQPPGFYIFKVTARITQPFAEVQAALFSTVRQEKVDRWIKGMQKELAPKIEKLEYFAGPKQAEPSAIATLPIPVPADSEVATVGGRAYTAKEMDEYMKLLPPQAKAQAAKEPEAVLTSLFMIVRLSDEARKRKLDQESPHKEAVDMYTRDGLATAVLTEQRNGITVSPAEQETYYKSHQEQFEIAKVNAIVVSFKPNPKPDADGKTPRTEDEAKARAEDLVKQLRGGADFAELAKANSDDKDSAAKGGEYATVRRADNKVPAPMKNVVFTLKDGAVSDPVRQPGAYYIFKTASKTVQPYEEVAPVIAPNLKQEKFNQWIVALQAQYKPKIEKPEYFRK